MVELQPSKLVAWVRFPSPALENVYKNGLRRGRQAGILRMGCVECWAFRDLAWISAAVAQLVECVLGKDEVVGSNPTSSSR